MQALAELFAHDRQQLRFPIPDGLMAHLDAPQKQDLAEVAQCQTIAQTAEHHECDDVARQAGPVQHAAAALVELTAAVPAAVPAIALCRDLRPFRHSFRATADTVHPIFRSVIHQAQFTRLNPPGPDRTRWHDA